MNTLFDLDHYRTPPVATQNPTAYEWPDCKYTIVDCLGVGRRRVCYKANTDSGLLRAFLIEKFNQRDVEELKHFRKVIHKLDNHPNIVKTFSLFWTTLEGIPSFIIVQECFTNTIIDFMAILGFKDRPNLIHSAFLQLAEGLSYMHRIGVIVNDISLDNILFQFDGTYLRVAYGDLEGCDLEEERSSKDAYNPNYLSHTRQQDGRRTKEDDVFSLGVCFSYIQWDPEMNIYYPYKEMIRAKSNDLRTYYQFMIDYIHKTHWQSCILKMMAEKREDRPTSQIVLNDLKAIVL